MKKPNIGLSEEITLKVTDLLKKLLANTYVLYTKTQVSHWNVEDPRFHSLHEMFEEQYEQLAEAVDEIAERIRALGIKSPLGLKQLLEHASIQEYVSDLSADQMLEALLSDHEHISRQLREGVRTCADLGDDGNADFMTARMEEHEKTAWMLRSSL